MKSDPSHLSRCVFYTVTEFPSLLMHALHELSADLAHCLLNLQNPQTDVAKLYIVQQCTSVSEFPTHFVNSDSPKTDQQMRTVADNFITMNDFTSIQG